MKAQQPERPTETELIARILTGDLRAFEALMRIHNRTLYRTARAILRDDAEAEDAVQEGYLQAYRALSTFRGDSKLSTWLVRIVANEALMRRRRSARGATLVTTDGSAQAEEACESPQPGPEHEAERAEMRRLLEARIDALPAGYRAVFVLRALEELTVEETAAALGIPEATVRTRYFRARGLLRAAMGRHVDHALEGSFAFAGARCDRIVRDVLLRLRRASRSTELPALCAFAILAVPAFALAAESSAPFEKSQLDRTLPSVQNPPVAEQDRASAGSTNATGSTWATGVWANDHNFIAPAQ